MGLMLCFCLTMTAQTFENNGARSAQNPAAEAAVLADILERYEALGTQSGAFPADMFTATEIQMLRSHLAATSTNNRMAVLLTEDFDDITTLPGAGYSFVNASDVIGTSPEWFQGNDLVFPAQTGAPTAYGASNFNATAGSEVDNYMITPPLDLENGDEIIFWTRETTGNTFPDRMEVRIDPTGANTDPSAGSVGSYTELLLEINPGLVVGGYPEVWTQFTVTVTGLTGTVNTRVAFRHWVTNGGPTGANSNFIGVDTLVIQEGAGGPPSDPTLAYAFNNGPENFGVFDAAIPATFTNIAVSPTQVAFQGAGTIDPSNGDTAYALDGTDFYSIDVATGVYTLLGTLTPSAGGDWTGLEFDTSTGTLYGIAGNFTVDASLYTIDIGALTATLVGTDASIGGAVTFAIDGAGVGYVTDVITDSLHSVDLATGVATLVGPVGINLNFGQGMVYDVNSDQLYSSAFDGGLFDTVWITIDTATGAGTVVGVLNSDDPAAEQFAWVGIPALITNDDCANAIAMTCGDIEMGDTTTNTDTGGANDSLDAWYSFTGTGTAEFVTFSLCDGTATHDTLLTVFDACGGAVVADNDDFCGLQSQVSFLSDGTTTYFVAVEGFDNTEAGPFAIEVSCNPVAANDLCDDATAIECGDVIAGSTNFATIDDSVASSCDNQGTGPDPVEVTAPGVWYTFTETAIPGLVQDINLSVCDDADFDTKISVYTGDCGTLTCVAADDDDPDCTGFTSTVDFQSDGVSTYYILVHGFGTATGDFNLTMTCTPVPPPNDMIVNSIDVDEAGLPYTDPSVNMPGATVEAGGTPAVCDNAGVLGVWYNFVAELNGTATAEVISPAGYTSVTFYTAPNETSVETDLTLVDWFDNQCVPGEDASIPVTAGQAYYVYVANHDGVTDIVIDGDFYLGADDNNIVGFNYYPNPATNELTLSSGAGTIESAVIYNILGQQVLSRTFDTNNVQLNVANLTVGTYIMKVVVDGEVGIYKIVKQ